MKKWQKILTICSFVAVVVLGIGALGTLFAINYNLDRASRPEIIDDGQNVYALAPATEGYQGYRFRFARAGTRFDVDCDSNMLDLSKVEKLALGQEYKISVCYRAETEGGNSRFSDSITWRACEYLDKPVLTREGDNLSWNEIENASYYVLCYGSNTYKTNETGVNLSKLVGGKYDVVVTAHANLGYYKSSTSVILENQTIVHKFESFTSIQFDQKSKMLTLKGTERLSLINVYINGRPYELSVDVPANTSETYEYKLDISYIYSQSARVGASPATVDRYNIFDGQISYWN